ncbi:MULTISPECIES: CPBP family intramembrane glutamic endopeptidase [Desulfobacter]|jgi:hypothetical protein|uniref:CPBP family intramembrane glutamic endopeptidase n=1 Tax=Desulfobacter TaxID=2289 RepID=UPI000E82D3D3|nr:MULTISPECIES: CPBP family intramembrane glutamic endopeptidase [unclassified Desulfobacter]MBP8828304.1 CPBP family intramembrane metalloprotease [Desulfobacter sp.]HAR33236.1 CPBP family intramembrane metalloprotease [Desulfobacter sp.]
MERKQATLNSFSIPELTTGFNIRGRFIGQFKPLLSLLFICYAPVALIWLKIIPFEHRFYALFFALAGLAYFCFHRRYRLEELGFRIDTLKSAMALNLLFCAIGGMALYISYKAGLLIPKNHNYYFSHTYLIYIFFLGPVQEIIFRGILFTETKRIKSGSNRMFLWISTLSFCFLHVIYRHPQILVIAFISGLIWGTIFIKRPNIWGVALSHSFLGALGIVLGLI